MLAKPAKVILDKTGVASEKKVYGLEKEALKYAGAGKVADTLEGLDRKDYGAAARGAAGIGQQARKGYIPRAGTQPSALGFAGQLAAGQARDRQTERATTPPEGPVLLELPTRSYTQPEETEEMHERARQQQMMRTMEAFTHPEGVEETPPEEEAEEAPEAGRQRAPAPGPAEAAQFAAQQQQARQVQAQELAVQGQQSIQQKIRKAEQYLKQLWRVVGGVQGIASIKIVPLITLVLQSNLQTINHIFHLRFIPEAGLPEDVRTGCLNGILCCLMFAGCVSFIAPFALVAAAFSPGNLWEAFISGIGMLFQGLF